MKRRLAELIYRFGFLKLGDFVLTSGIRSPYYVDLRGAPSRPEAFREIVNAYLFLLKEEEFDAVCGIAVGGLPFASAVAYSLGKPMVYYRKPKEHGTMREIEGEVEGGWRVVVLDDVLTTGGSIIRAAGALRRAGAEPSSAVVILDRQQGGREKLEEEGIRVISALTITELMENLKKEGLISREEYLEVLDYVRRQGKERPH